MIFSVDLIHTTNIETQPVKGFETNSSAKWVENNNSGLHCYCKGLMSDNYQEEVLSLIHAIT